MRTTSILTCLAAAASINAAAPGADIDAKSQKTLDAAQAFHAKLDTLHMQYKNVTEISAMGQTQSQTSTITVNADRPAHFSMHLEQDMMGTIQIISDGKELFTSVNAPTMGLSAYTQSASPDDFANLLDENQALMHLSSGSPGADASNLAMMFFLATDSATPFDGLESATYAGVEEIDGVQAHRIDAVFSADIDGTSFTIPSAIWIRQGDEPWIQGIDPDLSVMIQQMVAKGGMPPGMTFETTQRLIESGTSPTFDDDTFAFTPAYNAKKVESLIDAMTGGPGNGGSGGGGEHHGLIGNPAPSFSLDLLAGGKIDLAQHKGKDIVVLDFWATWCGPCVKAMPTLIEVTDKFKDQNVVFYAVNLREDNSKVTNFLKKKGFDTNVLLDKTGSAANAYGAQAIPQTVIIDKAGNVQAVHVGLAPNLKQLLTGELEKILKGENLY